MKVKIFFLFVFMLFISCNKKERKIEVTPISEEIQLTEIKVDSISEGCYQTSFIIDSLLFLTAACDENMIHIYNVQSAELIKKFGTKGQAPFEMLSVEPFTNITLFRKNDALLFFDHDIGQEKSIHYNNILSGKDVSENILSLPKDKDLMFSYDLTYLNDSMLCRTTTYDSKGLFFLYDRIRKEKKWIPYNLSFNVEEKYKRDLYDGILNANPGKSTILFAFRYLDQVLFYDFDGNLKKEYYFTEQKQPEFSADFIGVSNNAIIYALRSYSTKNYFYIYRVLRSANDIVHFPKKTSQILVFTNEGFLKKVFRLSSLPDNICVDEDDKILYTMNRNEEESNPYVKIIKYAIGEYLQ